MKFKDRYTRKIMSWKEAWNEYYFFAIEKSSKDNSIKVAFCEMFEEAEDGAND